MKKLISLFFALSVLCIFASASYSGNALVYDSSLPHQGQNWPYSDATVLVTSGSTNFKAMATVDGVYPLLIGSNGTVTSANYICQDSSFYIRNGTGGGIGQAGSGYDPSYQEELGIVPNGWYITHGMQVNVTGTSSYPIYESIQDAISDFFQVQLDSTFSLPAGNVAYMIIPSGASYSLSCVQNEFSSWSSPYWPRTGQTISYSASLPSSSTTFPLSGASDINWLKGGNPNILGQTKNAIYSGTSSSINYLVIYNPLYNASEDVYHDRVLPNGDIIITANNLLYIRIFPLTATLSGDSIAGFNNSSYSGSDYENYYVGDIQDDGSITWMNQNGDVSSPHIGGESYLPEEITVSGFLNKVVSILEDVVSSLGKIFGFAYEAIVSLVGLASNFVSVLGSLYAWLPTPLYSVLISAITLAITIGVFKVFL